MTPRLISRANTQQPTQNPTIPSIAAASATTATSTTAGVVAPAKASTAAGTVSVAPIACAKRFGGPGVQRGASEARRDHP